MIALVILLFFRSFFEKLINDYWSTVYGFGALFIGAVVFIYLLKTKNKAFARYAEKCANEALIYFYWDDQGIKNGW